MLVNALDLCVVNIVVLVAVEGDLREEIVPTGHVVLPPGGVDVVLGLVLGVLGNSGLVDHWPWTGSPCRAHRSCPRTRRRPDRWSVLLHVVDRDLVADLVVQLGVILAPLLAVQELCSGRLVLVSRAAPASQWESLRCPAWGLRFPRLPSCSRRTRLRP